MALSDRVAEQRAEIQSKIDALIATAETESRTALTDEETSTFNALVSERDNLDAQHTSLIAEEARKATVADAPAARTASVQVVSEPSIYRKGDSTSASYFRDLTAVSLNRGDTQGAVERLRRSDMEQRAISTTDGGIGEFVPPAWMTADYVALARAGRVTADLFSKQALPTGTDSINLPKITTGASTAEQTSQNSAVSNTDMVTTSVVGNVATIAGQQVVSVQLVEQSPVNLDQIILADLAADYATRLDTFCLSNNATGKKGILNVSSTSASTYTDASPTVAELYSKIADVLQQIASNRYLPADAIVMHPRRWGFFLAAHDGQNRPLVLPNANAPYNATGVAGSVVGEGSVGTLLGLPVYLDANIPTNSGAGTNQDTIIAGRFSDLVLFEGTQRAEAFRETKADQLSVLFRLYNYAAIVTERFPKSIGLVTGTGLVTPTF
jgi:HK97 family phage major capsid protein